jgi:hypothetical protein
MFIYILYGFGILYMIYCIVFCGYLFYTIFDEHRTEKRMKIKKEYDRIREDPPSCNIQIRTLGNYGSKLETILEDELSF